MLSGHGSHSRDPGVTKETVALPRSSSRFAAQRQDREPVFRVVEDSCITQKQRVTGLRPSATLQPE